MIDAYGDRVYFDGEESIFSIYYKSSFYQYGIKFETLFHYIVFRKLVLFNAMDRAHEILNYSLSELKSINKELNDKIDMNIWISNRRDILHQGVAQKVYDNRYIELSLLHCYKDDLLLCASDDEFLGIGVPYSQLDNNVKVLTVDQLKGDNALGITYTMLKNKLLKSS